MRGFSQSPRTCRQWQRQRRPDGESATEGLDQPCAVRSLQNLEHARQGDADELRLVCRYPSARAVKLSPMFTHDLRCHRVPRYLCYSFLVEKAPSISVCCMVHEFAEFSNSSKSSQPDGISDASIGASRIERIVIEQTVAQVFGVEGGDLRRSTRGRAHVARARQVAMYLAHVVCRLTLTDVGRAFDRDRTTVAHACGVIEDGRDDPTFDRVLDLLERAVTAMLRPRNDQWMVQ